MVSFQRFKWYLWCASLGALLGFAYAWAYLSGYTIRWQNLGAPAEEPRQILAASSRGVWVESAFGEVYVASPQGAWDVSTGNRPREAPLPPEAQLRRQPVSLEGIVDSQEAYEVVRGVPIYSLYALREDGNIYLWQDWPKSSDRRLLWLGPVLGALLALWLASLVWLSRWLPQAWAWKRKPGKASEEILSMPRDRW